MSSAKGDNPLVHFIRDGRFVCTAEATAPCRNYPACECEGWSAELHGDPPTDGHEDRPHEDCWIEPWLSATDLCDSYEADDLIRGDEEFPDGPVSVEWQFDYVTWDYADDTKPATHDDED